MLSLLAEDQKYLAQVCVKGLKGSEFSRVREWYTLATQHVTHLASLLGGDGSQAAGQTKSLFKTLNVFKVGLYSDDKEVARLTTSFFTQLMIAVNSQGGELVGEIWEWFTRPTHTPEEKSVLTTPAKPAKKAKLV